MKLRNRDRNNNDLDGTKLKPVEGKVTKRMAKKTTSLVSLGQTAKTSKKQTTNKRNSIKLELIKTEQSFDEAKASKDLKIASDDKSPLESKGNTLKNMIHSSYLFDL